MPEPVARVPRTRIDFEHSDVSAMAVPDEACGLHRAGGQLGLVVVGVRSRVSLSEMVQTTMGGKLRDQLGTKLSREVDLQFEFEQPPQTTNRVTIDPQYKDRPRQLPAGGELGFAGLHSGSDAGGGPESGKRSAKRRGFRIATTRRSTTCRIPITWSIRASAIRCADRTPGGHALYGKTGTIPRGPGVSARGITTTFTWRAMDMPTIGTSNPTFTLAALSLWAARTYRGTWRDD